MNITYLLGAGASANCLPVINELPDKLKALEKELEKRSNNPNIETDYKFSTECSTLHNALIFRSDILSIVDDLESHNTVDTLAKKYYLTNNISKLTKLKKVLISYFLYEQLFRQGDVRKGTPKQLPDKRYDSFIATIINRRIGDLGLPHNFKIITWNYDLQFELAYQEYHQDKNLDELQELVQAFPSKAYIETKQNIDLNRFSVVRLNGVAALHSDLNKFRVTKPPYTTVELRDLYSQIVQYYARLTDLELKLFNYSWENPDEFALAHEQLTSVKDVAKEVMRRTDVLVVIGYSFPLFNRTVDKELINHLSGGCRRVYIQDTPQRVESLKGLMQDSFNRLNPHIHSINVIPVDYVDQFFIPPDADK